MQLLVEGAKSLISTTAVAVVIVVILPAVVLGRALRPGLRPGVGVNPTGWGRDLD